MTNDDKIKQFLYTNHVYISTSDFLKFNIGKPLIKKYVDNCLIKKIFLGLYMDSNLLVDDEYVLKKDI